MLILVVAGFCSAIVLVGFSRLMEDAKRLRERFRTVKKAPSQARGPRALTAAPKETII